MAIFVGREIAGQRSIQQFNLTILTRLLRGRMGFKGYVNTDSGVLNANAFGVEQLTQPQRFAKAVKAGLAIFSDNNNPQGLIDAVNQHLLEESDLTPAVTLLLKEVFELGLFENPYTDPEAAQKIANSPSSAARADEARFEQLVLKNAGSIKQRDDAVTRRELAAARLRAAGDQLAGHLWRGRRHDADDGEHVWRPHDY